MARPGALPALRPDRPVVRVGISTGRRVRALGVAVLVAADRGARGPYGHGRRAIIADIAREPGAFQS